MDLSFGAVKESCRRVKGRINSPKSIHLRQKIDRESKSWLWKLIRAVFVIGFCFVILYPVLTMISKSFMHQSDIYDNTVIWIPKHFTLGNLKFAWDGMDYVKSFFNSFLLTLLVTLFQTVSCMVAGYGFARFDFPFKRLFFVFVVFTIIIPPQQLMIPLYLHFKNFDFFGLYGLITGGSGPNLLDSYLPFILLSATCMGMRNGCLCLFSVRHFGLCREKRKSQQWWTVQMHFVPFFLS